MVIEVIDHATVEHWVPRTAQRSTAIGQRIDVGVIRVGRHVVEVRVVNTDTQVGTPGITGVVEDPLGHQRRECRARIGGIGV